MNQQETKKIVPTLRFPEFKDAGGWNYSYGNQVFDQISNRSHNSDLPILAITQEYGAIPRELIDYHVSVSDKSIESYKVVEVGDFIISLRSFQGGIEYSKYRGICSPAYVILRKKTNISSVFFKHYLKTNIFIAELNKDIEGIRDGKMVSYKQFSNLLLPTPLLNEQQKIADCLTSLDDLITAENQKVAALKTHKKGLMQQLFPAEGETIPQLRFPEFKDAGEWEFTSFNELYSFKVTNSFSRDMLNYKEGSVKNIHYGDIHTKFSTLFNIEIENVPFVNSSVSLQKIKEESYCVEGDIVFADASEDLIDIGKSIEIINLNNERLISGLHTILVRQKKNKLILGFAGHLFKSQYIRKQIQKESQGAKVLGLSAGRLSGIEISYPPFSKEQQKIANCLTSLDDLITAQNQKIEALKTHKNGLMQKLFPSIDKVTL